jgi:two-component system, OmpR family, sensor kinase
VEQLLALARQEASAAAGAPPERVALADLARQAVADAIAAAQQKDIDLGLATAEAAPVRGYAEALRILLRNLVDNAVKYTPPGGVVDVHVRAVDGGTELVVEDSGPGIAEDDRERVLGRFYRAPAPEGAAPVTGSGLGLAIVQSIARLHGASVALDASPRLGGLRVALRFGAVPEAALGAGRDVGGGA